MRLTAERRRVLRALLPEHRYLVGYGAEWRVENGRFWPDREPMVYLTRYVGLGLVKGGWVEEHIYGPNVFTISPAGRRALGEWPR